MSQMEDPARWADAQGEAPSSLRALMQNARNDVPGPAALAALGVAVPTLAAKGVAGTAATKLGAAAAKSGGAVLGAKVGGAATLLIVAGASLFAAYQRPMSRDAAPSATVTHALAPATPRNAVETGAVETAKSPDVTESATPESDEGTVELPPPGAAPKKAAPQRAATPAKADAKTELELLQRARSLLHDNPARALELTKRHQREYPSSQFVQERQVIRIEALRALGREDEARKLGADFNQRFPDSAHGSRLDTENQ